MKKIYTLIAALGLCAVSASAAVTVNVKDGAAVADGETLTVTRDQFENTLNIPGVMDRWTGQVELEVEGAAPIAVNLVSTSADIQFCPLGIGCVALYPAGDVFKGETSLSNSKVEIPVDINYLQGIVEEKQEIKITFKDASGSEFNMAVVFDTTADSGVEAVAVDGKVTAYTIAGVRVLDGADAADLKSLPAGLYIVNGKKMVVK